MSAKLLRVYQYKSIFENMNKHIFLIYQKLTNSDTIWVLVRLNLEVQEFHKVLHQTQGELLACISIYSLNWNFLLWLLQCLKMTLLDITPESWHPSINLLAYTPPVVSIGLLKSEDVYLHVVSCFHYRRMRFGSAAAPNKLEPKRVQATQSRSDAAERYVREDCSHDTHTLSKFVHC